jgi:hypothetical protein
MLPYFVYVVQNLDIFDTHMAEAAAVTQDASFSVTRAICHRN